MIQNLPIDILLYMNKSKILSLKDISVLRGVNTSMNTSIDSHAKYFFTNELRKDNESRKHLTDFLDERLYTFFFEMRSNIHRNMNVRSITECITENIELVSTSYNGVLNRMFHRIFHWYLSQDSVYFYPCKFELYAFYRLYIIDNLYNLTLNFTSNIQFIRMLTEATDKTKFNDIIRKYFTSMVVYNIRMSFEDMYTSSKYVVTLTTLKKLMGYKVLDLTNAQMLRRTDEDIYHIMSQICTFRFFRPRDDLVGHNYNAIKEFLRETEPQYYNFMNLHEKLIIRDKVYSMCPYPIQRSKLAVYPDTEHKNDFTITYNSSVHATTRYQNIYTYIRKTQEHLQKKHFS